MKVRVENNFINLRSYYNFESVWFGEACCQDYDEFKRLPDVIEVNGDLLAKCGWNSDRDIAYYRSDKIFGRVV